ncbi:MAG TPA: SLBB domain-containing protein [Gemmatimonadales bacterium]|nr:SLBB domain-containing protein [Gemmatimonadales bacterium]
MCSLLRVLRPAVPVFAVAALMLSAPGASAQIPQVQPGQQLPSPEQAREALQNPQVVERLRQRLLESGLTPDQVRARLRASGYPETLLDDYLSGADTTRRVRPGPRTLDAVRSLGILSVQEADSLQLQDSTLVVSDSLQQVLDSIRLVRADSARADSLADSLAVLQGRGLKLFGIETFRRTSTRFQPVQSGPVDENYRLGPGDVLVLILTGDVEEVYTLNVTREGFVVIPQVGQVYVANLTMGQLEDQLYARLRRVYSGVRRSPNATTKFQISLARLRNIQVFVIGDVVRPGAYQISAAGTVLTALYSAGGPTTSGSFRKVEVRRGEKLIATIDVYDYLLHGINASEVRLQNGDVVFVPVHSGFVRVAGEVTRPAVYELLPEETLRDLLEFAGGFGPAAYQTRVRIHRILPPESRGTGSRARVVVDVGPEQLAGGTVPAVPMEPGDSVTVLAIAERLRGYVTVRGNVWVEGQVGYRPGMKLSEAIRLAGGPKPDVYLERILISRTNEDSSRIQLRSAFTDTAGAVVNDLVLQEEDEIRVFSRSAFLPTRYVTVTGAVRNPGRVPFREGMTMRDLVLLAEGVTEDADLREAEIARRDATDDPGMLAQTIRVRLDSAALASGGTDGIPLEPPHPGGAAGVPDIALKPYDNVLIRRQPGWETQRLVYLTGQVKHPGRYALKTKTDRLRDLLKRAGGLTEQAYPGGIYFYRMYRPGLQPSDVEPRRLDQQLEPGSDTLPRGYVERVGLDLPEVLDDDDSRDNIILVGGDSIHIPEYNPIVMVQGTVNSPGAVPYSPGKSLDWYVNAAGGYTQLSDNKHAYVTQPNGKRQGVKRRVVLADDVPKPKPGAVVFVPAKRIQDQPSNVTGVISTVASVLTGLITLVIVANQN